MLAGLAKTQKVKLIVSLDHIKSGILFSETLLDKFNFVCLQVDTFAEYSAEMDYSPSLFSAKNENQEIGLSFILKSMTQQQQQIVRLIAQYQLENQEQKGILVNDLFNMCTENMLCHSHKGLKDYLHEAKDHKIVIEKVTETGAPLLSMPYTVHVLEKIVNDQLD